MIYVLSWSSIWFEGSSIWLTAAPDDDDDEENKNEKIHFHSYRVAENCLPMLKNLCLKTCIQPEML